MKRQEYRLTIEELGLIGAHKDTEHEQEIIRNYLNHLKLFGQLIYVFNDINIINSEGDGWENDPTSTKAVLDVVLNNL